jgi:hypothetical protein
MGAGTGVPSSYTIASPLSFQPWFFVPIDDFVRYSR